MKKVILGTGLIICGVLGILTTVLENAIFVASPNRIIQIGTGYLMHISVVVLIAGVILNIVAFFVDED